MSGRDSVSGKRDGVGDTGEDAGWNPDGGDGENDGDGDVHITRMSLRAGGWIGYADDAVFVEDGDDRIKIHNDAIEEVGLRSLEWDIAVLSVLLVAVGGYVVVNRNPVVGVGFTAVGLFSLYRTYSQRHELVIRVENRPKPVSVHPEHPQECHKTLVDHVGLKAIR